MVWCPEFSYPAEQRAALLPAETETDRSMAGGVGVNDQCNGTGINHLGIRINEDTVPKTTDHLFQFV